jgi:hypothetical protein
MDTAPVVNMDVLWPELAEQRRSFEVVMTVPREDGGEPFVPRALPCGVLGCWSADQVVASVTVLAARASAAVAAAEALMPEIARSAGAVVTVRATETARLPSSCSLRPTDSPVPSQFRQTAKERQN